jgi:signal transduction histidine kinase
MRDWSLRARLTGVLATTLAAFALMTASAYLSHSRAEDRIEASFMREMSVVLELPEHRGRLRRIDVMTDDFLLTGDPAWLPKIDAAIGEFRASHRRIAEAIVEPAEREEWARIGAEFERYATDRKTEVGRYLRGQAIGRLAIRLALDNERLDSLLERFTGFGRLSFETLRAQRRAARRAAMATFGLVMLFGFGASLAVAALVARIVVGPVAALREHAGRWELGKPWTLEPGDRAPEIRGLMDTLKDMAGQLNAQYERERQAGRLKSQLVSGVSHEFNNALAVIHTAHALLKENSPASAQLEPWHDMMAANIRALSTMATNLLNLGRLESGKFALEIRPLDPAALMRESHDRLAVLARRKRLSVALEAPAGLPRAAGDPDALALVVANLFTNAVKYTPEGGSITLGARAVEGGRVELSVADTGIGIAPAEREKVFGGWYRTEEGKRAAKGFGVGLALSRMVLEAHGAELALESEPGKGSRFSFVLPAAAVAPRDPERIG